jgi:hypothetical protein
MNKKHLLLKLVEMTGHPKDVIDFVLNAKERNRQNEEIVATIKDRLHYSLSLDDVEIIYNMSQDLVNNMKGDLKELNDAIEEKKKYEFD